jgi:phenylacetate-CoA ligase
MSIEFKIRDFCYPFALLRLRRRFERSQWFSAAELVDLQERQLRRVVTHAYEHVPYYRDLFRRHGLTPADIRTRDDLSRLPTLPKVVLQREFGRLRAAGGRGQVVRTSGTSGEPVRVLLDKPANVLEFVYYWRHWSWAGYRLRQRFAELTSHFFLKHRALAGWTFYYQRMPNRLLLNSLALSAGVVREYAEAIRTYRPLFLKGIASALYYFARFCQETGITDLVFRGVFSTGEMLLPHYRRTIQETFHARVYDSYGHMERTVAISECPHGGLHVNPEYGVLELVDPVPCPPANGDPGPLGRRRYTASIVGTSLYNFAMPLLRYETGDVAEIEEPAAPCPCGRAMPRVQRIVGRKEDVIITPDGRVVTTLFLTFARIRGIVQGQVIQEAVNRLTVRVVPAPEYTSDTEAELLHCIRQFVGPTMVVKVHRLSLEDLRREFPGKFRTVISRLRPAFAPCLASAP